MNAQAVKQVILQDFGFKPVEGAGQLLCPTPNQNSID
jgi:hypothetical protein